MIMQQYTYEDQYRGQARKLLILSADDGIAYRVFCDANFYGSITSKLREDGGKVWKTDFNILKPIVSKIGLFIESQSDQDVI